MLPSLLPHSSCQSKEEGWWRDDTQREKSVAYIQKLITEIKTLFGSVASYYVSSEICGWAICQNFTATDCQSNSQCIDGDGENALQPL